MNDRVGDYVARLFAAEDEILMSLREEADRTGLPPISISADTGRLLQVLLLAVGARRVLEVGTLGGYSAIWIARALPAGGSLLSIELDSSMRVAARYFARRTRGRSTFASTRARLLAIAGERFDAIFSCRQAPLPTYLTGLILSAGGPHPDNALGAGRDERSTRSDARVRELNRAGDRSPRRGLLVPTHDGVAVGASSVVDTPTRTGRIPAVAPPGARVQTSPVRRLAPLSWCPLMIRL